MSVNPYKLENWIGVQVGALITMMHPAIFDVTIRSVEVGGLWIESEKLPVGFFRGKDDFDDEAKVVVFVPFSQIVYIATLDLKVVKRAQVLKFGEGTDPSNESPN